MTGTGFAAIIVMSHSISKQDELPPVLRPAIAQPATDAAFEADHHHPPAPPSPAVDQAIRDLGLTIDGSRLAPIIKQFQQELQAVGLRRLRPRFYLSTEWGVPWGTIAIAIPFYLARQDLVELHQRRNGHVEGHSTGDILRYFRHEMGHVVNYAYQLFDDEEWVKLFGSITQAYVEEYRPEPFSQRYVRHLPGWYAQKHPDEDWAESFAVWMTPPYSWREDYRDWPVAMEKLRYVERTVRRIGDREPIVQDDALDEDVSEIGYSLDHYYQQSSSADDVLPAGIDGALRAIFEDLGEIEDVSSVAERLPASELLKRHESCLMTNIYRWTGHFPERTRVLLQALSRRADALRQVYPADREEPAVIAITTLLTALAMNHVHKGSYFV